ncbi:hypothetical protein KAB70_003310 [Salmonella enterica]|nr:hypothetical protein [Salmonella enterica]
MFRRWRGEPLPARNRRRERKMFIQGVSLLVILVILETLYMMYVLWFV